MALHAVAALPSELGPVLWTHLREHLGDYATRNPHRGPTAAHLSMQPHTDPGVWFHDLPPLATI